MKVSSSPQQIKEPKEGTTKKRAGDMSSKSPGSKSKAKQKFDRKADQGQHAQATSATASPSQGVLQDLLKYQGLYKKAESLYRADEEKVMDHFKEKDKDGKYYFTMIKKGTANDKVNALQMMVKKAPARGLSLLQQLLTLARHKNRKQAEGALAALRDLFTQDILKDDAKLVAFQKNERITGVPTAGGQVGSTDLVDAYVDHGIKEFYRDYVTNILVDLSKDDLEFYRKLALDILGELIQRKPEIEDVILGILINKLGDGARKVQLHAMMVLCRLVKDHPQMARVIVHETFLMLQRPGLKTSQRYYAASFLNKVGSLAGKGDDGLRVELFKLYFVMFRNMLKSPQELKESLAVKKDRSKSKKQQIKEKQAAIKQMKQMKANGHIDQEENKIVELILKGVNQLMLYSRQDLRMGSPAGQKLRALLESEMNNLFRLTHHNVFRVQLQVFKLLFQFARVTQKLSKFDFKLDQTAEEAENADGASQESATVGNFSDRFYRSLYELILKIHMSKATNLDDYFGIVFKAVKADECVPRCTAFIKRLLQMCYVNEANFAAASLIIISEILKARNDIRLELFDGKFSQAKDGGPGGQQQTGTAPKLDQAESDDEEVFIDVDKVKDAQKAENKPKEPKQEGKAFQSQYDPFKREPKYSGAEKTQLFELIALCHHCHPTVRMWSLQLLSGRLIEYSGDPLQDFTLANFLDRIAYKEPKSAEKLQKLRQKQSRSSEYERPVNEINFKEGEQPETPRAEEEFMYHYLKQQREKKSVKPAGLEGVEDEDASDLEEEAFANEAIMKEMKRLQSGAGGTGESGSDDDVDVDYSESEQDEEPAGAEAQGDEQKQDDAGFFSDQEDLQDLAGGADDSEEEMVSDEEDDGILGVVDDDDEEEEAELSEEEDELPNLMKEIKDMKKKGKKKKDDDTDGFASYDDFAHLLEEGADQEAERKKHSSFLKKRRHGGSPKPAFHQKQKSTSKSSSNKHKKQKRS